MNFLDGCIRDIKILAPPPAPGADAPRRAHWPCTEGPGAVLLTDVSDGAAHAVLFTAQRRGSTWMPVDIPFATDEGAGNTGGGVERVEDRPANNRVQVACVAVHATAQAGRTYDETVTDLVKPRAVTLASQYVRWYRAAPSSGSFMTLVPDECYVDASSTTVASIIASARARPEATGGHVVLILRIGDAWLSIIDPLGASHSPRATFDAAARSVGLNLSLR